MIKWEMKYLLFLLIIIFFGCKSITPAESEIREYTLLNHEFKEILSSKKPSDFINTMLFTIEGNITGKAEIILYHPPFDRMPRGAKEKIVIEGKINKTIKSEWYDKDCLIHFIPENSLVNGEIKITYQVF